MSDIKYSELVAISGLSGLHQLVTNRSNGLIVEGLEDGKSRFVSARKHQFTPLESIAIYTYEDTIELKKVFTMMSSSEIEIPEAKSSANDLKSYFEQIIPEYDRDRVYPKDMKKVIKWYNLLQSKGMKTFEEEE